MSYLIDANALSELKDRQSRAAVARWFDERPASSLCLLVLTLGELRKGIETMAAGLRKTSLVDWLENDGPRYSAGRILAVDAAVADRWGRLCTAAARPRPAIDSLLAATALEQGLILVTRNRGDFELPGVSVFDPWRECRHQ